MNKIYQVEKPQDETNLFILIIQYIVLFIVLFLSCWLILPFISRRNSVGRIYRQMFDSPLFFSITFSLGIVVFLIYRAWKKYNYGEVYHIEFDDSAQTLNTQSINLLNNQEKTQSFNYKNVSIEITKDKDPLFGEQRILIIKNQQKKVHEINIDRTAWCRNEKLEDLFKKLEEIDR